MSAFLGKMNLERTVKFLLAAKKYLWSFPVMEVRIYHMELPYEGTSGAIARCNARATPLLSEFCVNLADYRVFQFARVHVGF
jgi:hypothetical protein